MVAMKKSEWTKIPIGSIIKANLKGDGVLYGIVRLVDVKNYAMTLIMLAASYRCSKFYKLRVNNLADFEYVPLDDLPLLLGMRHHTKALSSLFKGMTPLEINQDLDYEAYTYYGAFSNYS
jgi:hypothetical protein